MNEYDQRAIVETASAFKILSDPTRCRIIALLHREGGQCVYEIAEAVGTSPSAASHQLSRLESRGVVKCFRDGQRICYELANTPLSNKLLRVLRIFQPRQTRRVRTH